MSGQRRLDLAMRFATRLATRLATLLAVAGGAAGCGGKPAPETAPKGPAPCERVGDHLVGLLTKGFEGPAEERPTEAIDKLTRVIVELCTRGGWSADAQQCFLTVGSPAEDIETWDRCAGYLTVEQRDELPRAIDAAFGKQGGASGAGAGGAGGRPAPPEPEASGKAAEGAASAPAPPPPPAQAAPPPAPAPAKKARSAPRGTRGRSDPCEGGE